MKREFLESALNWFPLSVPFSLDLHFLLHIQGLLRLRNLLLECLRICMPNSFAMYGSVSTTALYSILTLQNWFRLMAQLPNNIYAWYIYTVFTKFLVALQAETTYDTNNILFCHYTVLSLITSGNNVIINKELTIRQKVRKY